MDFSYKRSCPVITHYSSVRDNGSSDHRTPSYMVGDPSRCRTNISVNFKCKILGIPVVEHNVSGVEPFFSKASSKLGGKNDTAPRSICDGRIYGRCYFYPQI